MTKPGIDFGQAEIQAFNNAIAAGEVHYDESAAKQAAQLYQTAIERLIEMRSKLYTLTDRTGFGGFPTGHELQQGFSNKARDGVDVITQLIDGAMRLQESYLRAGGLIEEADQTNGVRLKMLTEHGGTVISNNE